MIPIIVVGACGRMGRAIADCVLLSDEFSIVAGVAKHEAKTPFAYPLYADLTSALQHAHPKRPVIIDFSRADLAPQHIRMAQDFACPLLIGTTGHPPEHDQLFLMAAKTIPLVFAPNTSLMGVLMSGLTKLASKVLPHSHKAITDIHHIHKKDAPSGTAKALVTAMGGTVDVQSLRLGEILGEHTAYFVSDFERLEITHRVSDRRVFAQGALYAAQFIFNKEPGLYDMGDVLNLNLGI